MNNERDIFCQALGLESLTEREEFLRSACGQDVAMSARVRHLLAAHTQAGNFLAGELDGGADNLAPVLPNSAANERPGDRIGRYKLLEKIGEGGCGVVYLAEQEEPVRRCVALKIIKLGLETKSVIARFEAERQALAMMDHPNIAKVFDGGVTGDGPRLSPAAARSSADARQIADGSPPSHERAAAEDSRGPGVSASQLSTSNSQLPTGRPYFVMELVRGVRITDYCEQHQLSTRERLDLFIQVCSAIQHAHQKGVIHRDIKPSNVLVTENDGKPVPKVIDFGIAKATEQKLTDKTLFTQFAQFIGTPAYMSPEQAALTSLDIDTRSDIYSLGVLLYELLTGTTPFDAQELLKAGFDEMRRVIRETEPEKPSTRLTMRMQVRKWESEQVSKTGAAAVPPSPPAAGGEGRGEEGALSVRTAPLPNPLPVRSSRGEGDDLRRAGQAKALNSQLKPLSTDLDWIVMKCLEKDRSRRYDTANGLATDIQRHLSNEPVVARPPSAAYRFQKMVRRNKFVFVAGAGIATTLMFGLGLFIWQFVEKEKAYQRAQVEAAKSQTVAKFHKDMIWSMRPSIAMGRDTTLLLEFAEQTFAQLGNGLKSEPAVEIELRATLGRVFLALGDHRKAESLYQETLPRMRDLFGNDHPDVADLLQNYAEVLHGREKYKEAEAMAREALAINRRLRGDEHPDVAYALMLVGQAISSRVRSREELDQAELLLRQALAMHQKLHGPEHRDVALVLNKLARVLELQGRSNKAGQMYQQATAMAKRVLGDVDPFVVLLTRDLMWFQLVHANIDEVEKMYRELLGIQRRVLGNDNRQVARTLAELTGTLVNNGRIAKAEPLARESLALHRKLYGNDHLETAKVQEDLGVTLMRQGRHAEAEPLLRATATTVKKLLPPDDTVVALSIQNLGINLADQERYAEAEVWFREQVAQARIDEASESAKRATTSPKPVDNVPGTPAGGRTNSLPLATPVFKVVIVAPPDKPSLDLALGNLANAVYRQKKYPEAESFYREIIQRSRARDSSNDEDLVSDSASLGRLLTDWAWVERPAHGVPALAGNAPSTATRPVVSNAAPAKAGTPNVAPLERAREAERLLRESLTARLKRTNATPWKTSEMKSRLGAALVSVAVTDSELTPSARQGNLAEAETLLLEGNAAVQQHSSADRKYKRDTFERLIRLYEAWNKPAQAAEWRSNLESFEQTEAVKKSASAQEAPP